MAQATLKVEISFSANPLDALAGISWTDVTSYVRSVETSRGGSYQAGRVEAGTATVVLDNRDRRFDPDYAASPYSPNVKPWRRIRISGTHSATTRSQFVGYIEGWTPSWPGTLDAVVTLSCVDAFALLALRGLDIPYVMEVLADSPRVYHRLNETSGASAFDISGNGYTATYFGSPTFSQSDPITDDVDGAILLNGTTQYVNLAAPPITGTGAFTFEAWGKTSVGGIQSLITQAAGVGGQPQALLQLDAGKAWFFVYDGTTVGPVAQSTATYNDGAWHHFVGMRHADGTVEVFVDGTSRGTGATSSIDLTDALQLAGARNSGNGPSQLWNGSIDEIAIYPTDLSAARVTAHYDARTAWLNDLSGTRIGRVLDAVGWPSADRDVDAGQSNIQSAGDLTNVAALQHLLDVADWEGGLFFVDRSGLARFDDRHARAKAPLNTSQATFAWTPAGAELGFTVVAPSLDVDQVRNDIRITRTGAGTYRASDSSSVTTYGRRVLTKSIKIQSESQTLDRANWEKGRRKDPVLRVESIEITPGADDTLWTQVLTRDVSDRITVVLRPVGGGAEVSKKYHIEAIKHSADDADMGTWKTRWLLGPASVEEYWLLGDTTYSVLGSTTRLGA